MCNAGGLTLSCDRNMADSERPRDVGILAAEVSQEDLELHDGVPTGKYTSGLGQQALSFCGEREDAISLAMTALRQLMDRHQVAARDIGRLEVGTESSVDSSKSMKSHLMSILEAEDPAATDVEGCDCVHACYGGTAAVQNAANWVESRAWDGRLAVVVMADTAVYTPGPARPTSGAGAVALLLGPDAPLALERGLSATWFTDASDFSKPFGLHGLYPMLDGRLSVHSYLEALDVTYSGYSAKFAARHGRPFTLSDADHVLLHSPYNKLVQKAFARLAYLDMCRAARPAHALHARHACTAAATCSSAREAGGHGAGSTSPDGSPGQGQGSEGGRRSSADAEHEASTSPGGPPAATVIPLGEGDHPLPPRAMPRELERALRAHCHAEYDRKVRPSTCVQRLCGNSYTASLWSGLAQIIETTGAELEGRRLLLFSYGSGAAATTMSVVGRRVEGRFSLELLQSMSDVAMRLMRRTQRSPAQFDMAMLAAERRHGAAPYRPQEPTEELQLGTFYLEEVDERYRRRYKRKPPCDPTAA